MSSSIQAFCVKCQSLTEPQNPRRVTLQNQSHALKGTCKSCSAEVFRFLPLEKGEAKSAPKNQKTMKAMPDAFCVKCQAKTVAIDKRTVTLRSNRRAMRGVCQQCHSEVYKFLPVETGGDIGKIRAVSLNVISRHPVVVKRAIRSGNNVLYTWLAVGGFVAATAIFFKAGARMWQPLLNLFM